MIVYLRSCIKYFFFAGFFSIFINTLHLTFSLYMLSVYDRVLSGNHFSTLWAITGLALCALAVMGGLEFCRSRLLVRAGIKIDQLLTRPVLKAMLRDLGRLSSRKYTSGLKDINTLRNYLGGNSIFAFFDVPWIFIYLWIIYLVHPLLGMTATGGALVIFTMGLLQHWLTRKNVPAAESVQQVQAQWMAASFRTAKEIQSMGMVPNACERYCRINDQELSLQDKTGNLGHFFSAFSQSFGIFMQVLIYGVGAALVLDNQAEAGVIIAASIIMGRALAPVNQGIAAWKQTAGAKLAYTNLKTLLAGIDRAPKTVVGHLQGELTVNALCLAIGQTPVLTDIDFHLEPGEVMGLVGPNGAGKSSLCRVILGMWPPDSGRVCLDGNDLATLDADALGRFVGYLPQNVALFSGTVKDNIARMGDIDAEKIIDAAKRAGAHDTILRFPKGYDTDIGEAGLSLSGGQRQRVGLARALYGDPKLVILDEPNANLDEAGEQALTQAIERLKKAGTTTIMITHKPSLLYGVDKILVLENGTQTRFGNRDDVFRQIAGEQHAKTH